MNDEPRSRPLVWIVSLPLAIVAVWLVLVFLADQQRSNLIEQLADVAAHGSESQAAAAVHKLASLPRPPIQLLVTAASSPTRRVAREAQLSISDLIRRWQYELKNSRSERRIAEQVAVLVDSLAQQQNLFSLADYPWLGRTTRRIVRLANRFPTETSLTLASRCDMILAEVESIDASVVAFTAAPPPASLEDMTATAIGASTPASVNETRMPRPFSPSAGDVLDALGDDAATRPAADSVDPSERSAATPPSQVIELPVAAPPVTVTESLPLPSNAPPPGIDNPLSPLDPPLSGWQPRWTPPTIRRSVVAPVTPPTDDSRSFASDMEIRAPLVAGELPPTTRDDDIEAVATRTLLGDWLAADAHAALELERELGRRGFGRLSAELVEQLLADDADARQQLVDDLLSLPGLDSRPWLILLASDPDADVRLTAITMMVTSSDPQLIDLAWEAAVRDQDPRIADLVSRLHDRQTSPQQR